MTERNTGNGCGAVSRLSGKPQWEPVRRILDGSKCTHRQDVTFVRAGMLYRATFWRYYDRDLPQGERVYYDADAMRVRTGRHSRVVSEMLQASGWLSTFKRNVEEWADAQSRG